MTTPNHDRYVHQPHSVNLSREMVPVQAENTMNLSDFLAILNRHRLMVFFFVILALSATFYCYFNMQKVYQANATLFINIRNSGALLSGGQTFTENVDSDFTNTLVALVRSDEVASSVRQALADDPIRRNNIRDLDFSDDPVLCGKMITSQIQLKVGGEGDVKKANIIQVSYRATTSLEAFLVLEEIVKQFNVYFEQEYSQEGEIIADSIRNSRNEIEKAIDESTRSLREFIRSSETTFIGDSSKNPTLERLTDMENRLAEIEFQKMKYQKRLDYVQSIVDGRSLEDISDKEIITILGSSDDDETYVDRIIALGRGGAEEAQKNSLILSKKVNLEIDQRSEIESKITELEMKGMADDNPKILTLRDQLRRIDSITGDKMDGGVEDIETTNRIGVFTYAELLKTYLDVLKTRIESLIEQQEQMTWYIKSQDDRVRDIMEYCQTIDAMKFNISSQKEMFYTLGRKLDEVALTKSYGGYQVKVIDPPIEPKRPVEPNLKKFAAIGLFGGIFLGICMAFLLDLTDSTFRTPEEVETSCGVPLLAQIPSFAAMAVSRNPKKQSLKTGDGVPVTKLLTYHFPNAPQCEVFGVLLAKIFSNPDRTPPKSILITSSQPEEGKSLFCCNLAIKMAEMGKRVLLVDGDLRKPDLHKWFTLKNSTGISDVLSAKAELEDAIQTTAVENLSFLSVGLHRKNPANLLASENFDLFLKTVESCYDIVVFDSSPVLEVADAGIIAAKIDAVVFCMRIRKWARPISIQGVQLLKEMGANVLGCVVNCYRKHRFYNEFALVRNRLGYGYGNAYGSHYGYGSYGYGYGSYGYGYGSGYGYGYGYGSGYGKPYGKRYGYGYGKPYGDMGEDDEKKTADSAASGEETHVSDNKVLFPNLMTNPDGKQSL